MKSNLSQGHPGQGSNWLIRRSALIAVLIGAGGSFLLMLRAGQRNNSRVLLGLMTIWVLSPFVALLTAYVVSKRWSTLTRITLHIVMLVIALGSLASYGYVALRPPKAQAAAVYVVFPPVSWLLIGGSLLTPASLSGGRARRGDQAWPYCKAVAGRLKMECFKLRARYPPTLAANS